MQQDVLVSQKMHPRSSSRKAETRFGIGLHLCIYRVVLIPRLVSVRHGAVIRMSQAPHRDKGEEASEQLHARRK